MVSVKVRADNSHFFLQFPYGFAAAALPAKEKEAVAIAVLVIAGDDLEQC